MLGKKAQRMRSRNSFGKISEEGRVHVRMPEKVEGARKTEEECKRMWPQALADWRAENGIVADSDAMQI